MSARDHPLFRAASRKDWHQTATAIALIPALVLFSVGCTSTKTVQVQTSVPPAPGVYVTAVETTTGQQLDFDPPASVVENPDVGFVLEYSELGTFNGRDAWFDRTMELEKVRLYEVLEEQKSTNWVVVVGVVAAFGLLIAVTAACPDGVALC